MTALDDCYILTVLEAAARSPCRSKRVVALFEPGEPPGDCDTDGHYMCAEGVLEERYES